MEMAGMLHLSLFHTGDKIRIEVDRTFKGKPVVVLIKLILYCPEDYTMSHFQSQ